ncbi:MAG TPA: NHL repeat-containing protein [Candidatus Saccharicenans sp.]|nr:NHL repeat-containing protein [Candidatus Saccharicenans sp.]
MKKWWRLLAIPAGFILAVGFIFSNVPQLAGQKVEMINGVRVVHNRGKGVWGKQPAVKLEPVLKLGDVDSLDEHTAFYMPAGVAVDGAGNIYVLDSGNNRIQKFSPDGKFLASFGRFGQGPGEFNYPSWLDIDASGHLYVTDPFNERVQVLGADGKEIKTVKLIEGNAGNTFVLSDGNLVMGDPVIGFKLIPLEKDKETSLPKIVKVMNREGKIIREFGEKLDMKDELLNATINQAIMTVDDQDNVYLVFPYQNRIEKYSAEGKLIWRADRELPYSIEVQDKGSIERRGRGVSINTPKINRCAESIAVDDQGRVWVLTLARQLKKEEQAMVGISMTMANGKQQVGYRVQGETDLRKTDAYKLEVFDGDGVLLGEIPLEIFVDHIFIYGDRLFLVDKLRGATVYVFKIV